MPSFNYNTFQVFSCGGESARLAVREKYVTLFESLKERRGRSLNKSIYLCFSVLLLLLLFFYFSRTFFRSFFVYNQQNIVYDLIIRATTWRKALFSFLLSLLFFHCRHWRLSFGHLARLRFIANFLFFFFFSLFLHFMTHPPSLDESRWVCCFREYF